MQKVVQKTITLKKPNVPFFWPKNFRVLSGSWNFWRGREIFGEKFKGLLYLFFQRCPELKKACPELKKSGQKMGPKRVQKQYIESQSTLSGPETVTTPKMAFFFGHFLDPKISGSWKKLSRGRGPKFHFFSAVGQNRKLAGLLIFKNFGYFSKTAQKIVRNFQELKFFVSKNGQN